jgi:hypothetical protein
MEQYKNKRFEVLTALNVKITVFWTVMPGNMEERNQRFRRTYCLLFQGNRVTSALKMKTAGFSQMLVPV